MNNPIRSEIARHYRYQKDFAKAIGWGSTLVSNVLMGRRKLTQDEAEIWAKAIGCPLRSLADIIDFTLNETPIQKRMFPTDEMLTAAELATAIRSSIEEVREMVRARQVPCYKFGEQLLFDIDEVLQAARVNVKGC